MAHAPSFRCRRQEYVRALKKQKQHNALGAESFEFSSPHCVFFFPSVFLITSELLCLQSPPCQSSCKPYYTSIKLSERQHQKEQGHQAIHRTLRGSFSPSRRRKNNSPYLRITLFLIVKISTNHVSPLAFST